MTNHIRTLAMLLIAATVHGEDLPLNAQRLKESYQEAVENATTPLTKTYITELTRLKTQATKAGDLEGALAIDAELIQIQSADPDTNGVITKKQLINSITIYEIPSSNYQANMKFNADGTITAEKKDVTSWKLAGDKLRIEGPKNWNVFDARPKRVDGKLVILESVSSNGKQKGARITLR